MSMWISDSQLEGEILYQHSLGKTKKDDKFLAILEELKLARVVMREIDKQLEFEDVQGVLTSGLHDAIRYAFRLFITARERANNP